MKSRLVRLCVIEYLVWLAMVAVALTQGCQSPAPGLHDQLVRGAAVSPDEAEAYQASWWSRTWANWRSWFTSNSDASRPDAANSSTVRPVQPDDVTPATAWHVLQRLREEVERDLANPQD